MTRRLSCGLADTPLLLALALTLATTRPFLFLDAEQHDNFINALHAFHVTVGRIDGAPRLFGRHLSFSPFYFWPAFFFSGGTYT